MSNSPLQTVAQYTFRLRTLETVLWYTVSTTLFGMVYLWAAPEKVRLGWITLHAGDRVRLNERPLFVINYLFTLALVQSALHLYCDYDELDLSAHILKGSNTIQESAEPANPLKALGDSIPQCMMRAAFRGSATTMLSIVLYHFSLRSFFWRWAMFFFRPFYKLPQSNMLPLHWPEDIFLLGRCMWAGILLSFIWILGNRAFSVFMVKSPLKNGKPLTTESKDPNGSLLNGLKSKKQHIQVCFFFFFFSYESLYFTN
jgi:nucleoporin NDC1